MRDPKLQKLDGDALDQHTIELTLAGADAVIQTLGVSPNPVLIFSGTRLFSEATRILVDAMEARAVKRLICVTGLGAGDSRGHGGLLYNTILALLLGRVYADKDAQEWIIRRSRLDWTIVRPPSTLGYVSYFATWLLFVFFLSAALPGRLAKVFAALALIAMLLTGTRAAFLGLLAGAGFGFPTSASAAAMVKSAVTADSSR